MASIRVNSGGSKGFDFASDDVLCSFEDYSNHDSSNGSHSDSLIGTTNCINNKDFQRSRIARSSMVPPTVYDQQGDSFRHDVMSAVENSMKKYADNLLCFLEGLSSRFSHLESYCYNLDKSIGEMLHELSRDNADADEKLKSLEKHVQEVHRSIQILRDKQELAETRRELAKLQLAQKETTSSSHSQSYEERAYSASDYQKFENKSEVYNQRLALALPQQGTPQQQPLALPAPPPPAQAPPQNQQLTYNQPASQFPSLHTQTQYLQSQYISDPLYHTPQLQDTARVATPPVTHSQINQTSYDHYQEQQAQQFTQQGLPLPATVSQPSVQPLVRPPPQSVYSPYPSNQPANTPYRDTHPSSMPMPMAYPGVPQPGSSGVDAMPYSCSGAARPIQQPQPPPQKVKGNSGGQQGDGYMRTGPRPALPPPSTYMMYDSEAGRPLQQPQLSPQQVKRSFGGQQGDGYMSTGPYPASHLQSTYMMYNCEATRTQSSQPPIFHGGYPPAYALPRYMLGTAGSGVMFSNPSPSQFIHSNHIVS